MSFPAAAATGDVVGAGAPTAISGSYIVRLRDDAPSADTVAARVGGRVGHRFQRALKGFELSVGEREARRLAADPFVAAVYQNQFIRGADVQSPTPSWGLDRIDQRDLPLNNSYQYPTGASHVTAYVIDSGIRSDHASFTGRIASGADFVDGFAPDDCNGHGTHVSGILGGSDYGVAKQVRLVPVRVLDCDRTGNGAALLAGIEWVISNHGDGEPAVANISIEFNGPNLLADLAVERLVADGVTTVVAAGNSSVEACGNSPARTPSAITVGSTFINDERSYFSNTGSCVDLFAPGSNIKSAWLDSPTASRVESGTSMAAPHVAGAAALVLASHPEYTPFQVAALLILRSTSGKVINPGTNSFNRLLYVAQEPEADRFSMRVSPRTTATIPGGSVVGHVTTKILSGITQPVRLSASGLPSGASVDFAPSLVAAGGDSTLTFHAPPSLPLGDYPVTINAQGSGNNASAQITFTLTTGSGSCSASNENHIRSTVDVGEVISEIVISGCDRAPAQRSMIPVAIAHPDRGYFDINLEAPDGTRYLLKPVDFTSTHNNWTSTHRKNLSGESANGTWRLICNDAVFDGELVEIRNWALEL